MNGGMGVAGHQQPYGYNNPKHIDLKSVDSITPEDFGLTPDGIAPYIFGIHIIDPETGEELPKEDWYVFIKQAISQVENNLGIVIFPRVVPHERHDYIEAEFYSNNYIQTFYRPIIQVQEVQMVFNNQPMIKYPSSMWKVYHLTGELKTYPADLINGGGAIGSGLNPASLGLGASPMWSQIGLNAGSDAPQISDITYIAGMLPPAHDYRNNPWEMPNALKSLISKYVLKELIEIWGELILKPGIAGQSVSMDNMHESIQSTMSAENTGASARIRLLNDAIKELEESMRNYYGAHDIMGI